MEITAAIKGLKAAKAFDDCPVVVISDSMYVIKSGARLWSRKVNLDLWSQLDTLTADMTVEWRHVRGHSGVEWNEEVDRLAQQAVSETDDR
jgi:ribonuclease HI